MAKINKKNEEVKEKVTSTRRTKAKPKEVVEEVIEEVVEKVVVKEEPRRKRRVQIPKEVECVVMSLTNGELVYRDRRTTRLFEFPELASTDIMTIEELSTMKNLSRGFFKDSLITVIDVLDDEFTLEEVYEFLQIKNDNDIMSAEDMDDIILESNIQDFKGILLNRKDGGLRKRIVDRAVALFEEGEFNDYSKMKVIKDVTKLDYLFED